MKSMILTLTLIGGWAAGNETWTSRAAWIGCDGVKSVTASWPRQKLDHDYTVPSQLPAVYLRRDFEARGVVKAVLRLTAEGAIVPYLNGERVGADYFLPGWSGFHLRLYTTEYDVTDRIREGANTIGAILGDGRFRGTYWHRKAGQVYGSMRLRAKMELELTLGDGTVRRVATDRDWTASTGPILENDIMAGEIHDARLEQPGWCTPAFQPNGWEPVDVGNPGFEPKRYDRFTFPPVRVYAERKAVTMTEPKPGVFVFDMGQNAAGVARICVNEPAGTKVSLRFAERLHADGTIYTGNYRGARASDLYIAKGAGTETWSPLLTYRSFQYVEVTGLTAKPTLDTVTMLCLGADVPPAGAFECSDPLLNKIHSNMYWTLRSNFFDVPTDNPNRDSRMGWTGDLQLVSRTSLCQLDAAKYLEKFVIDVNDNQRPAGFYPNITPSLVDTNTDYHIVIEWSPGWGDAGIIVPYEIWRATGDLSLVRRYYPNMKRHAAYFKSQTQNLICGFGGYNNCCRISATTPPLSLISTGYLGHLADLMSRLAEALGEKADAEKYRQLHREVAAAFQKAFVAPDGKIAGDAQTSYAIALAFDLLTPGQEAQAATHLGRLFSADFSNVCGYGYPAANTLFRALQKIGRPDLAYRLLQNREFPSLGYEISLGASTVWEHWEAYRPKEGFKDNFTNSFNQYWSGACVEWLYEGILGISPAAAGYAAVRIAPQPGGGLTYAKGHIATPRGRIAVEWHRAGNRLTLNATVPAGIPATVVLPTGESRTMSGSAEFTCELDH